MSLASDAALLIYCDFAGEAAEHDDWHSHEHLHERLSIPGFVRGTRWARESGSPRYMIVYEVADAAITDSPAYLARLNAPSAWTRRIQSRVTMSRGAARIVASAGYGLGGIALSKPFDSAPTALAERLPSMQLPSGVVSAVLLEPAAQPPMTAEQSLRGRDATPGWTLLLTGHDAAVLEAFAAKVSGEAGMPAPTLFSLQHTVTAAEAARTRL